ncbi:MAG: NTP transferase domain-containing protein [Erysipelotrichaceae bacterium]|nr:NTP transferase domain-containing protein [Erysipelotrichaceae bacterium]
MYKLKINSILTDENDEKFFGNGPLYLLEGVRKYGSLSATAKAMNMSYSKAFRLIRRSEEALGFKLLESVSGGVKGGSSALSEKGLLFLSSYREYALANRIYGNTHLDDLFPCEIPDDAALILLASGKGKRFEENKLLYRLNGKPLISYLLDTLLPIKDSCIVSTIHEEVKQIGEKQGYRIAMHQDGSLSASIRDGLSLIKKDCAMIFVQADQPLLSLTSILRLIKAHRKDPGTVYRLSYDDKQASPILFPPQYYPELMKLKGEEGGSTLFKKDPKIVIGKTEALLPWELWDLDKKEELHYFEDMIRFLRKEDYDSL